MPQQQQQSASGVGAHAHKRPMSAHESDLSGLLLGHISGGGGSGDAPKRCVCFTTILLKSAHIDGFKERASSSANDDALI